MDRKKFKELSLKQKIEWLLQYYGVVAVVAVIALIVAVIFIKSVMFPEPMSDVCVLILSDTLTQEEAYDVENVIEDKTGKTAQIAVFGESDVYGRQAFSAKLTADELDLVVAPKEETDGMLENGYLISSEELEGISLYIGHTYRSREGEIIDIAYDEVKSYIEGKIEKIVD